jgi:hypothetical protein
MIFLYFQIFPHFWAQTFFKAYFKYLKIKKYKSLKNKLKSLILIVKTK